MLMSDGYESNKLLAEYLLFHYGSEEEVLPAGDSWPTGMKEALNFAARTASHFSGGHVQRSLDLGCAVGRSTFELARSSTEVLGIDYSSRFIWAAGMLASGGGIPYERLEEGHVSTALEAKAPDGVELDRVRFTEGDAMKLPSDLGMFDRVHAANLICRLPEPLKLLARLPDLVKPLLDYGLEPSLDQRLALARRDVRRLEIDGLGHFRLPCLLLFGAAFLPSLPQARSIRELQ
jgi:SAM-dependent methyltransferase